MTTGYAKSLENQVRFYEKEAESWKIEHERSIERRELEAILALGLSIFEQIQKADAELANLLQAKKQTTSPQIAREVSAIYQGWYRPCERLLPAIKQFKSEGYPVERSDEFIRACQKARIPAFHHQEWVDRQSH
jgi:hypothetical protein